MNQTITKLLKQLTQEGVSTAEVAETIGSIEAAGGAHTAMKVMPADTAFGSAEISPGGAADTPYTVTLALSSGKALSLKDFEKAYGESHFVPRMRPGQKPRVAFYYEPEGAPYSVAIFASHEDDNVISVLLRRDKRQ
ncbi:MAG: hypothetical protein UZ15_CFX003001194 [Chloroflexi bacterium OLB15]|nr:MAG: hypothetical protein UZ15_CFX003001194 [Chloroflexi bacterium OLB15]